MNDYRAIIFDMNGVIVDDEALHKQAEILTCQHFNLLVPEEEWDNFRGRKSMEIFSHIAEQFGDGVVVPKELVDYKAKQYFILGQQAELVPGVLEFIQWCREKYQYVALATSSLKIIQEFVFEKFGLAAYFDLIVTGDYIVNGKPDPEIYSYTVNKLGVRSSECLVVEDSDNGIVSGRDAGCFTLGITSTFTENTLRQAGANKVFNNFEDMKKYLSS